MYKVTIGVPIYNSSKLIRNALDSFVQQTMPKNDFEVICVDDCSSDDSLDVISEYKNKLNLRVLKLDENSGGPGKPRNKVIEEAKSEFIFFVDSDDYISENTLLNSYDFAKKNNSDIVLVKMKGVNGRKVPKSMFKKNNSNVDLYTSRLMSALNPLKLFKTKLLVDNNIFFPTNVRSAEDQFFSVKAYVLAEKISILADDNYYYATKHDGEHMTFTKVEPEGYYQVMCDTMDAIYKYSKEPNKRKDMLAARFINRHFKGRIYNTTIKRTQSQERKKWLDLLHNFIYNHVPVSVDKLVNQETQIRLKLARKNDQANYTIYEYEKYTDALTKNIEKLKLDKKKISSINKNLTTKNNYLTNTLNRKSIKATRKIADFISSIKK